MKINFNEVNKTIKVTFLMEKYILYSLIRF